MTIKQLADVELRTKRVLIRADLNVPLDGTLISDDTRIRATLPTIRYVLEQGASVLLVSHLGRPQANANNDHLSLAPVAARLAELLNRPVEMIPTHADPVDLSPW